MRSLRKQLLIQEHLVVNEAVASVPARCLLKGCGKLAAGPLAHVEVVGITGCDGFAQGVNAAAGVQAQQ